MSVDTEVGWETRDGMAAENVECDTRGEVLIGVERDFRGTLT